MALRLVLQQQLTQRYHRLQRCRSFQLSQNSYCWLELTRSRRTHLPLVPQTSSHTKTCEVSLLLLGAPVLATETQHTLGMDTDALSPMSQAGTTKIPAG